jgi:lipoprotein NlpD
VVLAASAPTATPLPASAASAPAVDAEGAKPPNENANKPGYYVVKPGDTLIRIGLDNGQNWRDLVKWNNLDNPNVIEVGQVLRVVPPGVDPTAAAARPVTAARVESKPLTAPASGAASGPAAAGAAPVSAATTASSGAAVVSTSPPAAREGDDDIRWGWPAGGTVIAAFDEGKNKGLAIAGKAGDPVLAAADGRVVYAGSGLRGYGNLVILKHNATYLTAYAHNQTLLVKEDQNVKRGQKIAEMGSTDADGVQLHFEIRKQGRPIDPVKLLPPR